MFARSKTLLTALTATVLGTAMGALSSHVPFNSIRLAAAEQSGGANANPAENRPAENMSAEHIASRLKTAYPGLIKDLDGNEVVFADGTRLPLDDGKSNKSFGEWLETPDIEDMFRIPYVPGEIKTSPAVDWDPGRARNGDFFAKIYGDCRDSTFTKSLVDVTWLPNKIGQKLRVSEINGAADRLTAVSLELDALPASFDVFLFPSAGTYNCRVVAGTKNMSAHSYGIAIDIALKHAHYWRWTKSSGGTVAYKNEIPMEIVRIFEKHGFIWGGKWYHYDTMHFEYRPELLALEAPLETDKKSE